MMDPLSALSLAGTVVQFVQFSSELLSQGRELYKTNDDGQLKVDAELELVTNDLCAVIKKFRESLKRETSNGRESEDLGDEFDKICDTTVSIAKELLEKLEKMKVNRPEDSKWKTLRQIMRIMWSRDEIDGFIRRLNALKEAINTQILYIFLEIFKSQSASLPATLDGLLDEQSKRIMSSVAEYTRSAHLELSQNLAKAMSQLMSRLDHHDHDEYHRRRMLMLNARRRVTTEGVILDTDLGITTEIEMLSVSKADEKPVRSAVQDKILQSLRYRSMDSRLESITNAHTETFEWACQASTSDQPHWIPAWTWRQLYFNLVLICTGKTIEVLGYGICI